MYCFMIVFLLNLPIFFNNVIILFLGETILKKDGELVLKVMPMPADTNIHGDIFGGWIKKSK